MLFREEPIAGPEAVEPPRGVEGFACDITGEPVMLESAGDWRPALRSEVCSDVWAPTSSRTLWFGSLPHKGPLCGLARFEGLGVGLGFDAGEKVVLLRSPLSLQEREVREHGGVKSAHGMHARVSFKALGWVPKFPLFWSQDGAGG